MTAIFISNISTTIITLVVLNILLALNDSHTRWLSVEHSWGISSQTCRMCAADVQSVAVATASVQPIKENNHNEQEH